MSSSTQFLLCPLCHRQTTLRRLIDHANADPPESLVVRVNTALGSKGWRWAEAPMPAALMQLLLGLVRRLAIRLASGGAWVAPASVRGCPPADQDDDKGEPARKRSEVDWDAEPLGRASDRALARKLKVGRSIVSSERISRKIKAIPHKPGSELEPQSRQWNKGYEVVGTDSPPGNAQTLETMDPEKREKMLKLYDRMDLFRF